MVDVIDFLLLWLIGKLGRNKSIPWSITAKAMFHRDKWYRKHRTWCKTCEEWVDLSHAD